MSDLRAAAQQALEALEKAVSTCFDRYSHEQVMSRPEHFINQTITALKAALEQPEQEPYAWMAVGGSIWRHKTTQDDVPLYTRPYRRKWEGLKEWEIKDGLYQLPSEDVCSWSFRKGVYFAEAALKEKNHE